MGDLIMNVEGRILKCERDVLLRIEYFRSILMCGMKESDSLSINLPEDSYDIILHLLHFAKIVPTGKGPSFIQSLSYERICGLLATAKKMVYTELIYLCEKEFLTRLNDVTIGIALEYCAMIKDFDIQRVQCQYFIEKAYAPENFKKSLFIQESIQGLSTSVIQMILRDMHLSTDIICDIILRWMFANPLEENYTIINELDAPKLKYLNSLINSEPITIPILTSVQ